VGGVSERPAREVERDEFAFRRSRERSGGRHPGLRDGGALRGASIGTRALVGPKSMVGLLPHRRTLPTTAGVLWFPRRGTTSAFAIQCVGTRREKRIASRARGRRVLHSVQRPVCVMPPTQVGNSPAQAGELEGRSRKDRGRANLRKREEPTPRASGVKPERVFTSGHTRLAARHRSRKREVVRDASEKEGRHGVRPCEDRELGFSARTQ
jgi:hypothetical protein